MSLYSGANVQIARPFHKVLVLFQLPGSELQFSDGKVIDCIGVRGNVLSPFITMKGKRMSYSWAKDSDLPKAWFTASPNGWTDNELGVGWLTRVFEPETV
jgi:hypothetical protein